MATQAKAESSPISVVRRGHRVQISAGSDVLHNIKLVRRIEDLVLGRLGHPQCYSGFDLNWRIRDRINPAQFMG